MIEEAPRLDEATRKELVASANLAPTAHNVQPTKWRFDGDGGISLLLDQTRLLPASDPENLDAGISVGTALEGTVLALSELGVGVTAIHDHWSDGEACRTSNHRLAARLVPGGEVETDPLQHQVPSRYTYRGSFEPASAHELGALSNWAAERPDITLVTAEDELTALADLNDQAGLSFLRQASFRRELISWMRLRRGHPGWHRDGMHYRALAMGAVEAFGAGLFLSSPMAELADKVGLLSKLASEKAKTERSTAIMLLHQPEAASPLTSGRALYRRWLEITELGFNAWPMSAVSDDPGTAAIIKERFPLPAGSHFFKALRLGKAPPIEAGMRARLPADQLILPS